MRSRIAAHDFRLVDPSNPVHDPGMVEYGHAVSQGTGAAGGGGGGGADGAQTMDAGAALGQWVGDAVNTVSTMDPLMLLLLAFAVVVGFVILKRAF